MKTLFYSIALLLSSTIAMAQQVPNPLESTPYIEVTGEYEMEIIPDEIYVQFNLKERMEGREKTDLEKLERELKKKLSASGFSLNQLSITDANADFITIKRKMKDVLASKDYQMKIHSSGELAVLLDVLDEIKVENASIARVDHSQMEEFKKQVKIEAVKNAKDKANYLLGALGEKTGKILFIQERESYTQPYTRTMLAMDKFEEREDLPPTNKQDISFKKIKLNYKVFARFAIQ